MQSQNLQIAPLGVKPVIHVSQFDVGRQFKFSLFDGETAYSMPAGTTAMINGIKPDNHGFSYTDAVSVSGNVATITTTLQMTIVEGTVECEIRFVKNEDDIGCLNFIMIVEKSPINETTDISDTEVPAIIALARLEMEAAADSAEDAEAYAVGTRGGVPVTSGDPTYENNAKYYSDKLGDDVDAAKNAAKDSEAYAVGKRGGVDVSSDDPAYHNNSKYYAGQASSSASSAGSAADRAEAAVVNEPYIGANGNWFVYNFQTQQYVDTNVDATGPAGQDGQDGATGNGIASITKTGTSGLVDTYTILYTNGQSTTFTVTNGANGTGSGDMMQADYDANSTVKNAGGIVAYVAAQISGTSLSGLSDVALSNLAAGQTLKYNATSQKWENSSLATVATSGSYADLSNKPTLGTAAAKDSTNAVTQNSTDLVESGAVYSEVSSLNSALSNKANTTDVETADNATRTMIAPIETSPSANAYSIGDFLIYNSVLYKVKAAIIATDALVVDTNIEVASNLETQIKAKQDTLTIDATPTSASTNPVQSGGTYDFVSNKHKITRKTVDTSNWTTDTTSQSGTTLYKKSISLSHVYVDSPTVDISTSNGTGLPTTAQQTAYDLLQYVTVDGTTLYLYASAVPSTTYYIQIEGVD